MRDELRTAEASSVVAQVDAEMQDDAPAPTSQPAGQTVARGDKATATIHVRRSKLELTDQQKADVLDYIDKHDPKLKKVLAEAKAKGEPEHQRVFDRVARGALYLIRIKKSDPELHGMIRRDMSLGVQIQKLARELVSADEPVIQSQLRDQLREKLEARFELAQERWKLQIRKMERQLDRMQRMIEVRQQQRDRIIEQQLEHYVEAAKKRVQAQASSEDKSAPTSQPAD
jgi:hypothetical protein